MVRYFGEPEGTYHGEDAKARTKTNQVGADLKDDVRIHGLGGEDLKTPHLQGYLQGFAQTSTKKGTAVGLGHESNTGFGPGGKADKALGANQKGQALTGQKPGAHKNMVSEKTDSYFLQSEGTFPAV